MTDAELIARLRDLAAVLGKEVFNRAADRIESLIAEREVWKDRAFQVQDDRDGLIGDLNAAEAKLAKAVEALRMIASIELTFLEECRDIARATLAEIKGESQ